jgi:hypothetical protein
MGRVLICFQCKGYFICEEHCKPNEYKTICQCDKCYNNERSTCKTVNLTNEEAIAYRI